MKADNEQGSCNQCDKDDAKTSFQRHESIMDNSELKSGTDKEILNGLSCDSRTIEGNEIHVAGVNEMENPDSNTVYMHCSAKEDSFEKDLACYTNKSVIKCYKNGTHHVVKDICVDEGLPVQEKYPIDDGVVEKDTGATDLFKAEEVNVDFLSIQVMEAEKSTAKHLKVCSDEVEEQAENPTRLESDSNRLMLNKEADDDTPAKLLEMDRGCSDVSRSSTKVHADADGEGHLTTRESSSEIDSDEPVSVHHDREDLTTVEEIKNGTLSEPASQIHIESITPGHSELTEQSSQSLSWRRSSETVEDSTAVSESVTPNKGGLGSDEISTSASQEPVKSNNVPTSKNKNSPVSSSEYNEVKNKLFQEDTNESNLFQTGFGETSFSASGPISGLITYSGPIAYSGNLSVRSDSSTTSTRSFAFPVLQSEWNSSPVRMARADRRQQLRRQKGWRQTLLCCRF